MMIIWLWPIQLDSKPIPQISIPVHVTAYSPTVSQTDSTPYITASGIRVRKGIIALSWDLEKGLGLKFKDIIHLKNLGTFEFQDRMNKRWKKELIFSFGNIQMQRNLPINKT